MADHCTKYLLRNMIACLLFITISGKPHHSLARKIYLRRTVHPQIKSQLALAKTARLRFRRHVLNRVNILVYLGLNYYWIVFSGLFEPSLVKVYGIT
jgi:hypothetical protein